MDASDEVVKEIKGDYSIYCQYNKLKPWEFAINKYKDTDTYIIVTKAVLPPMFDPEN